MRLLPTLRLYREKSVLCAGPGTNHPPADAWGRGEGGNT